ncbi:hypothetical protein NIES2109_64960 (plasmid) [Nostoc sp. HK-01]|nr:hypothetical protein NIES2109_64960 [Nostoc sp. HK-01]
MTHNDFSQQSLKECLDSLPRLFGTQSPYYASLKRIGKDDQRIVFPNRHSITCPYQELINIAKEYSLPPSPLEITTLLSESPSDNPIDFFRSRVIAVAIISGFGIVRVEFPDSRSFIGKVEIFYRGQQRRTS